MTRFYKIELPVAPFLIAPLAQTNSEAAIIFGPAELGPLNNKIVSLLHGPISRLRIQSPILAQALLFKRRIIAAITFRTRIPDAASQRLGLKLTFGVLISRKVFFQQDHVISTAFSLFHRFLSREGYLGLSEKGASQIVQYLQDPAFDFDKAFGDLGGLLQSLESTFWLEAFALPGPLYYVLLENHVLNILGTARRKPALTVQAVFDYWDNLDHELSLFSCHANDRPFPLELLEHPESKNEPLRGQFRAVTEDLLSRYASDEEHLHSIIEEMKTWLK